jgi:hypothetical protein
VQRLGGCSRKPGSGQTVDSDNIPARELGTRPCTRSTASSHEGTTRPAEALREALRPRRSQTTPPRPRGLHPAGALARTHRYKTQPRKAGPLAKKCDKSFQASINTPFEARGLLSGTIIRGTLKAPKSHLVTPISTKLQRPDWVRLSQGSVRSRDAITPRPSPASGKGSRPRRIYVSPEAPLQQQTHLRLAQAQSSPRSNLGQIATPTDQIAGAFNAKVA